MSSVSGVRPVDARPEAVAPQVQRLWSLVDRQLVWLCLALISVDLFFVAVHAAHTIYAAFYTDRVPVLGWRWNIMYDRSYQEIFGYLKTLFIISLLVVRPAKKRYVYLGFAILFMFVLADDALMLHEALGQRIASALALRSFAGLRPVDFGELLFWTAAGILALGLAVTGLATTTGRDRANGLLLLGVLAALFAFAVGVDMAHVVVEHAFRGSGLLFTLIEEGGQQIVLSVSCGLAILVRREVRSRDKLSEQLGHLAR